MSGPKFGFSASEVIKNGKVSSDAVNLLKPWLKENNLPELNDEQIIIFLLCCDNVCDAAKTVIKAFYDFRNKTPEVFTDRKLSNKRLEAFLNVAKIGVMPNRTADDCTIIIHQLTDVDYKSFDVPAYFKAQEMTIDGVIYDMPSCNLIMICDVGGLGLMHLTKIRLGLLRDCIVYIQDGLRVNLRKIYFLNCNYFIDKLVTIMKPFIKSHLFDKILFFPRGMDMEHFHKTCVSKEYLPEDYGGLLPSVRILHEENVRKLVCLEEYFETEERQRML